MEKWGLSGALANRWVKDGALMLQLADSLSFFALAHVVYVLRHGEWGLPPRYMGIIGLAYVAYWSLAYASNLYGRNAVQSVFDGLVRVVVVMLGLFAAVLGILFLLKVSNGFSRVWLVGWLASVGGSSIVWRLMLLAWVRQQRRVGRLSRRVAILGDTPVARQIARMVGDVSSAPVTVAGIYRWREKSRSSVHAFNALYTACTTGEVDDVLVTANLDHPQARTALLDALHRLPVNVHYVLPKALFGRYTGETLLPNVPTTLLYRRPLEGSDIFLKRAMDILASVCGLLAASPVMLFVALAVKVTSPGPILFCQKRGGFQGADFGVYKFRTMRVGADAHTDAAGKEKQAVRGDARLTPIGSFLRSWSLDELPQLFNILKGDMSVVGPRPHAASHDAHYGAVVSRYASRHRMKPGLTGWAQLNGLRGETETVAHMAKRVEYDIWYTENWTLGLDLKIVLLTPLAILFQKKAY